jgi:NitT/TauT family transport system substrate-binding protein
MREDYAVQAVREIPYGRWQEYDPEDTIRFYSRASHEGAMIKSSPQKSSRRNRLAVLKELKKELKA